MQTALHIHALVAELRSEILDGEIIDTEYYRKERAAYLFIRHNKTTSAFGFVFHPAGSGCFLVPARKARPDTREKPRPAFPLDHFRITAIDQPTLDRLFFIDSEAEGKRYRLSVEAIGPNGNLWLLDSDNRVVKSLRPRDSKVGDLYDPAPVPPGLNPLRLLPDELPVLLAGRPGSSLVTILEKGLSGFNRTLALEAIRRAELDFVDPEALDADDRSRLCSVIKEMAARFDRAEVGYLHGIRGGFEVYPFKLGGEAQPEKFKSLSAAVLEMVTRRQVAREEESEQQQYLQAVKRAIKRIERRIVNLEADLSTAADFEDYKRTADLLQIHRDKLSKGMEKVEVPDVYRPDHTVMINLDPAASPQENIEKYIQKYRKGRDGLEKLQRRLEISRDELGELLTIAGALKQDFGSAVQQYAADLAGILPREAGRREALPRLPYREHMLSTGVRVFVGRDGSDNDRTTFEFAKPYELWFHAQQCPGSHVVMKFPNKSFEPSAAEIAETAELAAWHSKARHDSLVPVVYTERRYVRKPRKAKPGLVTVEREKSIMVEPRKPD
jgi:predicted ribosome quality control (RQC) complex YloA/Tae2 family protein